METTQDQIEAERDDYAVDRFAAAMKEKLATARRKGRSGWHDPDLCSASFLAELLISHLSKGNEGTFLDVANFCMMLHQRGESPNVLRYADRLAAIERDVRELADLWDQQQSEYPNTQEGEVAAAAVRCCARELCAILDPEGS